MKKYKILMCGSDFSVGGGMVAVVKKYINHKRWNDFEIIYVPTHVEGKWMKKCFFFIKGYFKIWKLLLQKKINLAHLHVTENGSFYRKGIILRILKIFGIQTILHHHTDYSFFYSRCNSFGKKFVRETFCKADRNIVLGKYHQKWAHDIVPDANVIYIYNAVEPYVQNMYNPDGKKILFLGWLIDRKGIYEFLQALKELDGYLAPEYQAVLCGHDNVEVKKEIERLSISHRIAHIGWVDKKTKQGIFADTVVNVLPTWQEGLPMTILETMAYGIPNIATNISTIPEIIPDGEVGTLIAPKSIEQLKKAIYNVINDRGLRLKQSHNSYERIKKEFNIEKNVEQMKVIYRELLGC